MALGCRSTDASWRNDSIPRAAGCPMSLRSSPIRCSIRGARSAIPCRPAGFCSSNTLRALSLGSGWRAAGRCWIPWGATAPGPIGCRTTADLSPKVVTSCLCVIYGAGWRELRDDAGLDVRWSLNPRERAGERDQSRARTVAHRLEHDRTSGALVGGFGEYCLCTVRAGRPLARVSVGRDRPSRGLRPAVPRTGRAPARVAERWGDSDMARRWPRAVLLEPGG